MLRICFGGKADRRGGCRLLLHRKKCVWSNLLEELLVEVFSWLPAESLIRFKCVNKYWYGLITSLLKNSSFVHNHFRNLNSICTSSSCMVFCCPGYGHLYYPELESLRNNVFKSLTIFYDPSTKISLLERFDLPLISGKEHASSVIGIHCNGIICQVNCQGAIALCNPVVKQWRNLPKTCLIENISTQGVGFGYDSKSGDYKVVRFGWRKNQLGKVLAEVYSMRSNSWREIGVDIKFKRWTGNAMKCYCNGFFYWSKWVNSSSEFLIISFDMCKEVFSYVALPGNNLVVHKEQIPTMAAWNDSLALMFYSENKVFFELWVLNNNRDHPNKEEYCWSRKLVIEAGGVEFARPLNFMKNDEILMQTDERNILVYNIRNQVIRKRIQKVFRLQSWDFFYAPSLVSVHGISDQVI
ncbi:hypothetical protein CsatA_015780 [Cannabis sativa]